MEWVAFSFSKGDLPDPGIELPSPACQVDSLQLSHQGFPCDSVQHTLKAQQVLLLLVLKSENCRSLLCPQDSMWVGPDEFQKTNIFFFFFLVSMCPVQYLRCIYTEQQQQQNATVYVQFKFN